MNIYGAFDRKLVRLTKKLAGIFTEYSLLHENV